MDALTLQPAPHIAGELRDRTIIRTTLTRVPEVQPYTAATVHHGTVAQLA